MAIKKISELSTKSFLGNPGAAANSYVLINYEDSTTNAPVTYKASLQELGKAIATDLKLPTVTVSEGVPNLKVKTVSNGAYVDNAISGLASTGYVTTMAASMANIVVASFMVGLASEGYVNNAISGLATEDDVNNAVSGLASEGYVNTAVLDLTSTGYVNNAIENLASEDYVDNAISSIINNEYGTLTIGGKIIYFPTGASGKTEVLGISDSGELLYLDEQTTYTGPHILGYEINGSDLILKSHDNTVICTLSNVIQGEQN